MPKNKILRSIKINNGVLEQRRNDKGESHWYRNGKPITSSALRDYKFYDPSIKGFRYIDTMYNQGTPVYTPNLDKLDEAATNFIDMPANKDFRNDIKPSKKHITLRTKGRMNLATIPNNMLDSIYISTGRANGAGTRIRPKDALGLIGKESTFGGMSIPLNNDIVNFSKWSISNNHAFYYTPQENYLLALSRKYPTSAFSTQQEIDKAKSEREANAAYAIEHGLIDKANTTYYNDDGLTDAFIRYGKNPAGYNPGQGNYVSMVNNIANEVWNEPQIQKQWAEEGRKYYEKGIKEGQEYAKRNKKENGGYIRRTIGGKYSIF